MSAILSSYLNPASDISLGKIRWAAFLVTFTAVAIIAPYACHQFGIAGMVFLPMHFAVMIAAAVMGTRGGITVALISPFLSFAISSMPPAHSLAPMTAELVTYAAVMGILANKFRSPLILSLILAMIAGRIVSAAVVAGILQSVPLKDHLRAILIVSLPGIAIQLALVPPLAAKIRTALGKN